MSRSVTQILATTYKQCSKMRVSLRGMKTSKAYLNETTEIYFHIKYKGGFINIKLIYTLVFKK